MTPAAAARFALSGVGVGAGALSPGCLFACTLTGLGNITFSSKSSGNFTETITVAKSQGTAYTSATLAASR